MFFVNSLKGPAREHFLRKCRSDMPYREIMRRMRHQYNSEAKQSTTLLQMLQLHMPTHVREHSLTSENEGLRLICELIEQNSELLEPEFATKKHKVQFLRKAVLLYALE